MLLTEPTHVRSHRIENVIHRDGLAPQSWNPSPVVTYSGPQDTLKSVGIYAGPADQGTQMPVVPVDFTPRGEEVHVSAKTLNGSRLVRVLG